MKNTNDDGKLLIHWCIFEKCLTSSSCSINIGWMKALMTGYNENEHRIPIRSFNIDGRIQLFWKLEINKCRVKPTGT